MNGRTQRLLRTTITLMVCALLAGAAWASKVRLMTVEDMTDRAAKIFYGRCIRAEQLESHATPDRIGVYTFRVEQTIKGELAPVETVRMIDPTGDMARNGTRFAFIEGERAVLFLYGENGRGLTSPVGLGQGRFTVVEDKHGRKLAVSGYARFNSRAEGRTDVLELGNLLDRAKARME